MPQRQQARDDSRCDGQADRRRRHRPARLCDRIPSMAASIAACSAGSNMFKTGASSWSRRPPSLKREPCVHSPSATLQTESLSSTRSCSPRTAPRVEQRTARRQILDRRVVVLLTATPSPALALLDDDPSLASPFSTGSAEGSLRDRSRNFRKSRRRCAQPTSLISPSGQYVSNASRWLRSQRFQRRRAAPSLRRRESRFRAGTPGGHS